MNPSHSIAILLCTYNGARFLEKQLDSIVHQTHGQWTLFVSDDGSTDDSVSIIHRYMDAHPQKIVLLAGPRLGFVTNFMSLIRHQAVHGDFYALADQDDIWETDKLERAVNYLEQFPTQAALYCSRTRLIDAQDKTIGFSALYKKNPCFENALMHNIASGNTMVFNQTARDVILQVPAETPIHYHDWWVYLVVSASGGHIRYDSYPSVRYRQHESNLIGGQLSLKQRLQKIKALLSGEFADIQSINLAALEAMSLSITDKNKKIVRQMAEIRTLPFLKRAFIAKKTGIFCQTWIGNCRLGAAILFNKL